MKHHPGVAYRPGVADPQPGDWCAVRSFTWGRNWEKWHPDKPCPVCREKFERNEPGLLLINNFTLFPNAFVHTACAGLFPDQWSMIESIAADYASYRQFREEYRAWIPKPE